MRTVLNAALASALALGLPVAAGAQTAPAVAPAMQMPAAAGGPQGHEAQQMTGMMQRMMRMMDADGGDAMRPGMMGGGAVLMQHTKGMIAFYKAELDITAAQEPQWVAFARVLSDAAATMHKAAGQREATPPTMTAPERMDAQVARLSAALDTVKALAGTGKALYAVLTPDQRLLADGFLAHPVGGRMP